jgi:TPR repeat protein
LKDGAHHQAMVETATEAAAERTRRVGVMAHYEMAGAELAATPRAQAGGEACYELGLMYATGETVPLDRVAAHKWFNIAVARGFRPAATLRSEVAQEMSAEEIAAAQREARMFLTHH